MAFRRFRRHFRAAVRLARVLPCFSVLCVPKIPPKTTRHQPPAVAVRPCAAGSVATVANIERRHRSTVRRFRSIRQASGLSAVRKSGEHRNAAPPVSGSEAGKPWQPSAPCNRSPPPSNTPRPATVRPWRTSERRHHRQAGKAWRPWRPIRQNIIANRNRKPKPKAAALACAGAGACARFGFG